MPHSFDHAGRAARVFYGAGRGPPPIPVGQGVYPWYIGIYTNVEAVY